MRIPKIRTSGVKLGELKKEFVKPKVEPEVSEAAKTVKPRQIYPSEPKEIPKEIADRGQAVFLMLLGVPLIGASTYALFERFALQKPKKVQLGEFKEDGTLREFSEYEIYEKENNSWSTRIFGTEGLYDILYPKK